MTEQEEFEAEVAQFITRRKEIAEAYEVERISVGEKDFLVCNKGNWHRFTKMKQFKTWIKLGMHKKERPAIEKLAEKREVERKRLEAQQKMTPEIAQILTMAMAFKGKRK